jgi:CDP-4-dehydro-6-deoxyglucose reductase
MPDPTVDQTWHGVPRGEIDWHPTVIEDLCMGCGLCVTGCGRQVYGYDYDREKAIVLRPESCLVGCITCSNLCPEGAIRFPSIQQLQKLIKQKKVLVKVKKEELPTGKDRWAVDRQG